MESAFFVQFLTLSLYVIFVAYSFCDGFKVRKRLNLIWAAVFIAISALVLKTRGEFDLSLILPVPTLFAIVLGGYEIVKRKKR